MTISKDDKSQLIKDNQVHETDTGSPEVQIAVLTARIQYLTQHLQQHPKDFHTRRGLLKMVGRRRKVLRYLKQTNVERYQKILQQLNLKK